jgi:hypothetical protein
MSARRKMGQQNPSCNAMEKRYADSDVEMLDAASEDDSVSDHSSDELPPDNEVTRVAHGLGQLACALDRYARTHARARQTGLGRSFNRTALGSQTTNHNDGGLGYADEDTESNLADDEREGDDNSDDESVGGYSSDEPSGEEDALEQGTGEEVLAVPKNDPTYEPEDTSDDDSDGLPVTGEYGWLGPEPTQDEVAEGDVPSDASPALLHMLALNEQLLSGPEIVLPPYLRLRNVIPPTKGDLADIDVGPLDPSKVKKDEPVAQERSQKQERKKPVKVQRATEEHRILFGIHTLMDAVAETYPESYAVQSKLLKQIVAFKKTRYAIDGPERWIVKRLLVICKRVLENVMAALKSGQYTIAGPNNAVDYTKDVEGWEDMQVSLRDRFDPAQVGVANMMDLEAAQNNQDDRDIEFVYDVVDADGEFSDLDDTEEQDNLELQGLDPEDDEYESEDRSSDEEGPPIAPRRRQTRQDVEMEEDN